MRSLNVVSFVLALTGLSSVTACSAPPERTGETALGETSSAIIHGTASPASQDSVVMISLGADGFCSGTLIAPNVVLTARHCVTNLAADDCGTFQGDVPLSTLGIVVGAGATDTSTAVAHAKKYFYVDGAKDLCGPFDMAVILLDRSLTTATSTVRTEPVTVGERLVAVGYGEDENHALAGRRQRTDVSAVAVGPATKTFTPTDGAATFTYQIPLGEIATSEAACHGDSGGPIFDTEGRVVGVTSRGADPNDVCVARPDIYTAVAAHIDIIDAALAAGGFPRQDTTTTKPNDNTAARDPTAGDDASSPSDSGNDTTTTSKPAKKKSSATQPAAGCAVSGVAKPASPSSSSSPPFGVLVVVGLALASLMRRRRSST